MASVRNLFRRSENGQALIFFAATVTILAIGTVLVVEGSRLYVEYRQMQAAADMSALVGAQKLPCASGASGTTCVSNVTSQACTYVDKNGYGNGSGGCSTSGDVTSSANVPPLVCSPYDYVDYGNNSTNAACQGRNRVTAPDYNYLEVKITKQLHLPSILGVAGPISLSAHAIARFGVPGAVDYAIADLDPTSSNQGKLTFGQNGIIYTYGSISSNSTASGSITMNGSGQVAACNGSFYADASGSAPSAADTYTGGTVTFAPPGCIPNGGTVAAVPPASRDSPTKWVPNSGQIPDPYATSQVPFTTTTNNLSLTCTECTATAWFYKWTATGSSSPNCSTSNFSSGTWDTANNLPNSISKDCYELFPGIYPNGIKVNGNGVLYFNPGVYTFGTSTSAGNLDVNGGFLCIFGAPACDVGASGQIPGATSFNCSNAVFAPPAGSGVASGTWYYYCSPWGIWDSSSHGTGTGCANPCRPASLPTSAPVYFNTSTQAADTMPLNGITLNMAHGTVKLVGNGAMFLAAPNPCPGTGTAGTNSIPYPSGADSSGGSANYNYNYTYTLNGSSVSPVAKLAGFNNSGTSMVYPSADFRREGECTNPRAVWKNELGDIQYQHLHFLIFAQSQYSDSSAQLEGGGQENWFGIVHTFPNTSSTFPDPPTSSCLNCSITIGGNAGGSGGPPMLAGQIIGDNLTFHGASLVEVFNRPGGSDFGPGTSLVQ